MERVQDEGEPARLYGELASWWPLLSPEIAYQEDSLVYRRVLREHAPRHIDSLLDLGCGAGYHARFLKLRASITGVDISPEMLTLARRFNPKGEYHLGDVRTVRLAQRFDAVLMLDALNYLLTADDLGLAFTTAYTHLEPQGILLTQADFTTEDYPAGQTYFSKHESDGTVVRVTESFSHPQPPGTTYTRTFDYRIEQQNQSRHERDVHHCGLFPEQVWHEQLANAGFLVRRLTPHETGKDALLFIGLKPKQPR